MLTDIYSLTNPSLLVMCNIDQLEKIFFPTELTHRTEIIMFY